MNTNNGVGKIIILVIIAIILIAGAYFWNGSRGNDYRTASYMIDNRTVSPRDSGVEYLLKDELVADFDVNGMDDSAFLISTKTSTTTLYYLVAALQGESGYTGTKARLIGAEIMPMTLELKEGDIVVNYAINDIWHSKTFGVRNGELLRAIKI